MELPKLRDSTAVKQQLRMEWGLVRTYWIPLVFCVVFQLFHSIMTNVVFYLEANRLKGAERIPLHDLGFEILPDLSDKPRLAALSEYLTGVMFLVLASCIVHTLLCESSQKRAAMVMTRRYLICVTALQTLRIISFCVTMLPGPAEHCRPMQGTEVEPKYLEMPATHTEKFEYSFDTKKYEDFFNRAPKDAYNVFFSMDATTGCGDLMFSSHTIFSMSTVCLVFLYFPWALRGFVVVAQCILAPLIIASHKHYTLDVVTSMYVTPLVWFLIYKILPDPPLEKQEKLVDDSPGSAYNTFP